MSLPCSKQVDRGLAEAPGPLGACDERGPAAVCHQAAVQDAQERGDHARTEDVLDREVVTYKGFGVQLCPLAGGYGDLGELLARGAILVHVAGGGEA